MAQMKAENGNDAAGIDQQDEKTLIDDAAVKHIVHER